MTAKQEALEWLAGRLRWERQLDAWRTIADLETYLDRLESEMAA